MAQQTSTRLNFSTLNNTRDLGGLSTTDGRTVVPGRLIRSGHLYFASAEDQAKLADMLDTVVDFRNTGEQQEKPDPVFPGVREYSIPILGKLTAGISHETEADKEGIRLVSENAQVAHDYMCTCYRDFITGEGQTAGYRQFLDVLEQPHDRAVLWHCTAGKDRAGFGAVIVEALLGVPWDTIRADYLYTNVCLAEEIRVLADALAKSADLDGTNADDAAAGDTSEERGKGSMADTATSPENRLPGMAYLFGAYEDFLDTALRVADEAYGGFDGYLRDGLGVSADEREALRERFLA